MLQGWLTSQSVQRGSEDITNTSTGNWFWSSLWHVKTGWLVSRRPPPLCQVVICQVPATTTFHISNCRGPLEDPGTIILQGWETNWCSEKPTPRLILKTCVINFHCHLYFQNLFFSNNEGCSKRWNQNLQIQVIQSEEVHRLWAQCYYLQCKFQYLINFWH